MYKILHMICDKGGHHGNFRKRRHPALARPGQLLRTGRRGQRRCEKIITKNGESYIALIDASRLDYYHQLERERIHLLLIDEASKGLDDVAAGKVKDARSAIQAIKRRRSA